MATLFTYRIPVDDGAAPNPFWGVCTLVICKPRIRSVAKVGDWVVGTGSANSPIGDIHNHVVYAMQVTEKMTMREYDQFTRKHLTRKIPKWNDRDPRRRLGDSIYDFNYDPPKVRTGVHDEQNRETDLGGRFALLSDNFYYFGDNPQPLPYELLGVIKRGRGHRSKSNAPYVVPFLDWLFGLGFKPNRLYGNPQWQMFKEQVSATGVLGCLSRRTALTSTCHV